MGLKKYDANEANKQTEEVKNQDTLHQEKINSLIEANKQLEEEQKNVPLNESQDEIVKNINVAREEYLAYSKKQKRLNYVLTGAVVAIMIVCFVLIIVLGNKEGNSWILYMCLGIMIAVLVLTFILTKVFKNKLSSHAQSYIDFLYKCIDNYLFNKENFSKSDYLPNQQMDDHLFMDGHFYKNIKGTKSRNLVVTTYKDKTLSSADLAGNILIKNRTSPMFLGKFYDYGNNYRGKDKYILFQLKGGQLSRPLDDVDGLTLVEGDDEYCIYTNDQEYKKVFTKKTLSELRKFKIDSTLIDVIFSIREGKTCLGIDYADEFMNIPVESKFTFDNVRRSEQDLEKVLAVFDTIE